MIQVRDFLADQRVMRAPSPPADPLVSVMIPTFRRAKNGLLGRAVESILAQSLTNFELFIMDDGSTDGSFEMIEAWRAGDARIVHVRHDLNCGLPALRINEGIELARGKFLAFQFDDDSWRPHALEALVEEAERHDEPTVVVGRCHARGRSHELMMPFLEVNLANLTYTNFMANNSVLVPRSLADEYGMYDCHVAMRRIFDWDLWQRLIRRVPFVAIDEIISDMFAEQPDSVMLTTPYDFAIVRYLQAIDRNDLLTPRRWRDYEVDALRIGRTPIGREFQRRLYEEQIVPYYGKFRHGVPKIEGFPANLPSRRRAALYARPSYDSINEIAFNHYDALANRRGTYKASFQYSTQMLPNWVREADVALVIRPYREHERLVMDQGLAAGLPMGVYLDDDFLALHEYGPPFDYMAPGTLGRRNLVEILERADAVWVTSRFIAESVRPLNRRIVPHQGTVPHEWLPADVPSRDPQRARRIGCVGTSFREEELRALWEALVRLSREYGTRLEFEFWGLDVSSLPALAAPVRQVPYETSYFRFMLRLQEADFDILVTPLFDRPRARLAKAPSKYFQVAAAGALGVFSRVPPYERLPEGLTCLKAENTVSEWYRVLREAVEMPAERFDLMRRRTLAHVREEFTETAEIDLHEAAWRATEFHAKTRAARDADGRPRVVYALGMADGELDVRLLRWLDVAQQYAVAPLVLLRRGLELTAAGRRLLERLVEDGVPYEVVPLDALDGRLRVLAPGGERERHELQALLERVSPALVHTLGVLPLVGQVSASLGLPHVASLYAVPDEASWHEAPGSHRVVNHSDSLRYAARWREWLGSEKFCAREPVPQASIDLGLRRHLETLGADPPPRSAGSTRIVVAAPFREGGGQLEAIGAATALKRRGLACELLLCGNTEPDPDYLQRCRQRIEIAGLSAHVALHGAVHDWLPPLENADLVLSPATWGDFPLAMKDAMAIGVLVVATPVGGVPEIVLDGVSGILCADGSAEAIADALARAIALSPDERRRIVEQARRVARSEFHPQRAASDLLDMYIRAIDLARGTRSRPQGRPAAAPDRRSQPRVAERVDQPAHPPASHVELRHALTYRLVPRDRSWHGLDVLVGTHQRTASGRLDLALLSPAGDVLRTACVDLATARDNDWLAFTFAPIHNAAGRPFLLRFSLANPGPDTRLSLYDLAPLPTRLTTRALRRLHPPATRDSLYCRLRYAHREDVD